ncbi:MAG: PCRF domain-containing protein, partial [Candidatus Zixiibacteriota bacterium]
MPSNTLQLLEEIQRRYDDTSAQMADPQVARNPSKLRALGREHHRLSAILQAGAQYKSMIRQIEEAKEIIAEESDPELVNLAKSDLESLLTQYEDLEERLQDLLIPPDPNDG